LLKNNLDFNHIDKIIKNGLTNRKYYRVLGIIGQSEQPPDNNQIKENFKKIYSSRSWDKYYYEILKQLSPNSNDVSDELLFTWEELMILEYNQLRQKCHNILQKIHHLFDFKIDNHLKENYLILMDGNSLKESNKWIIIQKNDITLKNFNPYVDEDIIIMIYDNSYDKSKIRFFPILTNKKKGKIHVYSKSYTNSERRQFLNLIKEKPINFVLLSRTKK